MKKAKTAIIYGLALLLLGIYWALSQIAADPASMLSLSWDFYQLSPLLLFCSGLLFSSFLKIPEKKIWLVLDLAGFLFLLTPAFRFLTISLIGVGHWSWLALHTPSTMIGCCGLLDGLFLGHLIRSFYHQKRRKIS